MAVTARSLGIDKLPLEERLALLSEIWDGISAEAGKLELTDQMKAELDNRISDADSNPGSGIPWEIIESDARGRFKK